jgi:hypothetical protein
MRSLTAEEAPYREALVSGWRVATRTPSTTRTLKHMWLVAAAPASRWCNVRQEQDTATHDTRVRSHILFWSILCAFVGFAQDTWISRARHIHVSRTDPLKGNFHEQFLGG